MIVHVPNVLPAETLSLFTACLADAPWDNGRVTADPQSGVLKDDLQLPENSREARDLGDMVLNALDRSPMLWSATLPADVYPPLFNKYAEGVGLGSHMDDSICKAPGSRARVRTDVSATLFLSQPESYGGGELVIEDTYGAQSVKLPAGDLVLHPATSLHHVRPVTRGEWVASFFWPQSMVKDAAEQRMLFELDQSIRAFSAERCANDAQVLRLTGLYHNLVRKWGEP